MLRSLTRALIGDDSLELRHRLFHWLLIFAVTFCLIGSVINVGLTLPALTIWFPPCYSVFLLGLYFWSRVKHAYDGPVLLTVSTLIFLANPLFWFTNGGSQGGAQYFGITYSVAIAILIRDRRRTAFLAAHLGVIITLVVLEMNHPEWVVQYPTPRGRLLDVAISLVVVSAATFRFFDIYATRYEENTRELETLARTDGLTGLLNHSASLARLKSECERAARYNRKLSVIMFDVDHFKRLNDALGHQQGDVVLEGIGEVMRAILRKSDLAGRYGGEEFIIALPETPLAAATTTARKLCTSVAERLGVTLSAGVSEWDGTEGPQALIARADAALYAAKGAGRNLVKSG